MCDDAIREFIYMQEPLGKEFDQILHENLWELMDVTETDANIAAGQVDGAQAILKKIK